MKNVLKKINKSAARRHAEEFPVWPRKYTKFHRPVPRKKKENPTEYCGDIRPKGGGGATHILCMVDINIIMDYIYVVNDHFLFFLLHIYSIII